MPSEEAIEAQDKRMDKKAGVIIAGCEIDRTGAEKDLTKDGRAKDCIPEGAKLGERPDR